jgi:DtxR family manganese transport transcriptional regulator
VTHVTVNKTLHRLKREGLVETEPYRAIFLTDAGKQLAERSRRRHALVVEFLVKLGVDAETAELDAEGIEHHISDATLSAIRSFVAAAR